MQTLEAAPTTPIPSAEELEASVTFAPEQVEQEAQPQPEQAKPEVHNLSERKELHSLSDFEDLIGQPLPEEIKRKVEKIGDEKLATITAQSERVSAYIEELTDGVASRWIAEGYIQPPSVSAEASPDIIKSLEGALEEYSQTEAGKKDLEIKTLRDFLQTEQPAAESVATVSRTLGLSIGSVRFKLSGGYRQQSIGQLKKAANKYLDGVTKSDSGFDEDRPPSQEQAKRAERGKASETIHLIVEDSTAEYRKKLGEQEYRWQDKDLKETIDEVHLLEELRSKSIEALKASCAGQPPEAVLSALLRGSLTSEDITTILAKYGDTPRRSSLYASATLEAEKRLLQGLYPEPSLAGLAFGEEELKALDAGVDKLLALSTVLGYKPFNKQEFVEGVQANVADTQQLLFERVESSNSLYWHFSPYGLRILHEKKLMSGALSGNRLTSEHSQGVHFVKPGFGMQTDIAYSSYAQTQLTLGGRREIPNGFGLAVIYKLEDVIEQTPLRDEPMSAKHIGKANIAEDVTFRTDAESAAYSYPIEDAYVLPMLTWEQINHLRSNPDFSDLMPEEYVPPDVLALTITKRALELEGFSPEWIDEHLLSPDLVPSELETLGGPGAKAEVEEKMYQKVSHEIMSRQKRSEDMIVPLRAKRGAFESHDSRGVIESWKEELVKLSVA